MSDENNKNVFYINHRGELLIWLIVILFCAMVFCFSTFGRTKAVNEYKIFMPDVDGLIVGSPVRTMGIEVGHVTKIKPVRDEVYIKFVITDNSVKIPRGTVATVEFSGMAGSKSLELYLPDENTYIDSSVPIISASEPKRLNDAAGLLNEMFKKIGNIIAVSSRFGKKLSEIDFPEKDKSENDAREFIKFANEAIDIQQERVDDLGRKINDYRAKKQSDNSIKSNSESESNYDKK